MEEQSIPQSQETSNAAIKALLKRLKSNPCPRVLNPPNCKKRASVSLIIRFKPQPKEKATYDPSRCSVATRSFDDCLDNFFDNEWVCHSSPEVLFIKRAARLGDRWSNQVALPGGKRDPEDIDDRAASVRETFEETGLELQQDHCLPVGNLPERLLTTAWGKLPFHRASLTFKSIMVLCPFVYLLMRYDTPPLDLQPAEVHSVHWVSLHSLLAPASRTCEYADISDRAQSGNSAVVKRLVRLTSGQMVFSAVELHPSESTFSSLSKTSNDNYNPHSRDERQRLLLWGLTLGIVADFLQFYSPDATKQLWRWPTFSHWDIRFIVWALTRSYRARKIREADVVKNPIANDASSFSLHGMDPATYATSMAGDKLGSRIGIAGGHLLDEYFDNMKRAVNLALGIRVGVLSSVLALIAYTSLKRRQQRCAL
ncbi:uncharacterized protein KY384_000266 [Bacidia gigantensis]|uniref:uncharacterized protein n=1 Tax=Bacidia gigantensis TaxID=2732470 RepID=UPI001D04DF21|nr:uncharacterized protein KY384_000266 [Bacidia gigantensis]KAG8526273.1 hypothetical protein KY384_000266 [Bacidia gigantensis]